MNRKNPDMPPLDEQAHAVRHDGYARIVRRNRSGKWWYATEQVQQRIPVRDAAILAANWVHNGQGAWRRGLPGGGVFDRHVTEQLTMLRGEGGDHPEHGP